MPLQPAEYHVCDTPTDAPQRARHRRAIATAALLAICLLAVGCGNTTRSQSSTSTIATAHALAFSKCMRANGVPGFPDAGGAPTGDAISTSFGDFYLSANMIRSPAFKAAMTACARLLPGGAPRAQRPSAQLIEQTRALSVCMREHGVSGFPDPTFVPPGPGNAGQYSLVTDMSGVVLALPSTINPQSPSFIRAAQACNFQY